MVCEPTKRAVATARSISQMAEDLGIKRIGWVANKVHSDSDREFVRSGADGYPVWGFLSPHRGFLGQEVQEGAFRLPPAFLNELRPVAKIIAGSVII